MCNRCLIFLGGKYMKSIKNVIQKLKYKHPWDKFYQRDERTIEVPNMSLYELLREQNKDNLDSIAVNYFNKKWTFRQLFNEINQCAKAMRSQGIRPGDVVTICMANTPEAVISFYAVNKIGAIANMIHPLSAEEEIKASLIATNSVMLVAINLSYAKIKEVVDKTNVYKTIIVSPSDSMPLYLKVGYYLTAGRKIEVPKKSEANVFWNDFMMKGKNYTEKVLAKTTKDQHAVILHSGGTTGVPKNIVLTNGNINAIVEQAKIILPEINNRDSMLTILPLFHCFGLVVGVHAPLCLGASVILIPQFDAKRFDKLLSKYHPTLVPGVPTLFEALITNKYMDNVDLSYVKYAISGGDTLSVAKNEEVNKFLRQHGCRSHIIQGYGMTETTGPVTFGALGSDVLGSVGIPLPSNEVKIVSVDTREEVPLGETGEICISGPTVMVGYLDNEKETNEILEVDKRGKVWVHTGDLGYMNEDGVLFFAQRLKRMLIVSGYNVYPSHIEDVIMEHEAVLNCGVIGVPHPYKVQVPKAYIVLKNGVKVTSKIKRDIKEHCEKNLAKYMLPKEYEFRESLPKTLIGKVDYRQLEKENK